MKRWFWFMLALGMLGACTGNDVTPRPPVNTPPAEPVKKETVTLEEPVDPPEPKLLNEPVIPRTDAELKAQCARGIQEVRKIREEIVKAAGERTVENTLEPYNRMRMLAKRIQAPSELLQEVHPDANLRQAAEQCAADDPR